jgi:hypothetical protein
MDEQERVTTNRQDDGGEYVERSATSSSDWEARRSSVRAQSERS